MIGDHIQPRTDRSNLVARLSFIISDRVVKFECSVIIYNFGPIGQIWMLGNYLSFRTYRSNLSTRLWFIISERGVKFEFLVMIYHSGPLVLIDCSVIISNFGPKGQIWLLGYDLSFLTEGSNLVSRFSLIITDRQVKFYFSVIILYFGPSGQIWVLGNHL